MTLRAAACALALTALACARPGAPAGGPADRRPPDVVGTEPAPGATVSEPLDVVRFRFSERVSERPLRGTMDEAVLVSPSTGAVRVDHGRDAITVHVEGGLRPGAVYRFTVLPVIQDLFGNAMRDAFELVISTGGPMVPNALAGQAVDRITGRPVPELVVQLLPAVAQADTLAYVSRTDEEGLYFFRFVPPGQYSLVAFQDRNRSGNLDPRREPFGQRNVLLREDTLLADLTVLEPDSTAATLTRAEAADSATLRLVFSDFLDPEFVGQTAVTLQAPEGRAAPRVAEVLHPQEYEARRDTADARARAQGQGPALAVPGQERGGMPAGLPLPRQEVVVLLDAPLEIGVSYRVSAAGVVNINRIPLGRGDTIVVRRAPARARPAAGADSAAAGGLTPDTAALALARGRRR